jgi:trans-aconitate methyltransferase
MNAHHGTHPHFGHEQASSSEVEMAKLLELDAEVLGPYLTELAGWLADVADPVPARILDLGCGPGTGSLTLARQFPEATVTAVDISPQMLHRLQTRAAAHGVAGRIHTLQADLDEQWPQAAAGKAYDLIWAAAFLHHLTEPGRTLTEAFHRLRPGGLLAVTEMDFFPRFLPEDAGIGRADLETRLHTATNTQPRRDWAAQLEGAGFTVDARRPFEIRLDSATAGPALNRYAHTCLTRLRSHASDLLDTDDLTALDTLLDEVQPNSILRRRDLTMLTTRTTWIARRP